MKTQADKQSSNEKEEQKKQAVPSFLVPKISVAKDTNQNSGNQNQLQHDEEEDKIFSEYMNEKRQYQEFQAFSYLMKIQNDPSQEREFFERLEIFTQKTNFQSNSKIKRHSEYIQLWSAYASLVQDSDKVYNYMIDNQIGADMHWIHLNLAFYLEKFKRDFNQAEEVYRKALKLQVNEQFLGGIMSEYQEFSIRMSRRVERDIIQVIGEEKFKTQVKNKKRKYNDAFPEVEAARRSEENKENQEGSKTKKRKINNQVRQYQENVIDYDEGIKLLKQNDPNYQELTILDSIKKELEGKPLSWISKNLLQQSCQKQEEVKRQLVEEFSQIQLFVDPNNLSSEKGEVPTSIDEIRAEQYKSQIKAEEQKQIQTQQRISIVKNKVLEEIGETSQDLISNNSFYNRKASQNFSLNEESKQSIDTNVFKTANNSLDEIAISRKNSVIEEKKVIEKVVSVSTQKPQQNQKQENKSMTLSSIKEIFYRGLSQTNDEEQKKQAQDIFEQLQSLFEKSICQKKSENLNSSRQTPYLKTENSNYISLNSTMGQVQNQSLNQTSNLPCTQPVFQQLNQIIPLNQKQTLQTQAQNQQKLSENQNPNFLQVKPSVQNHQSQDEKKRFSGIFMKLIEEGERNQKQQQMFDKSPMKPINGPSLNANFFRPSSIRYLKFIEQCCMNDVSNNSILDVTPRDNNFLKHVNPNYSQELFFKKKTMSKTRENQQFGFNRQSSESEQQIMSPFGLVSPMNNQSRSRVSGNYHQDCYSKIPVFEKIGTQNQFYNRSAAQAPTFIQTTQNHYQPPSAFPFNQLFGSNSQSYPDSKHPQTSTYQPQINQTRDSVDSQGQVFQDCQDFVGQTPAPMNLTKSIDNSRQLPSVLKQDTNEVHSRNTSKSVRFKNY